MPPEGWGRDCEARRHQTVIRKARIFIFAAVLKLHTCKAKAACIGKNKKPQSAAEGRPAGGADKLVEAPQALQGMKCSGAE